jgi:hypothetical protein
MRHVVIFCQPRCTIFFHIILKRHDLRVWEMGGWWVGGGPNWTQNVCFNFLYNFCLKYFLLKDELSEIWSKMYIGLYVQYPLLLSDFNETWIFSRDFRKICIWNFMKILPRVGGSCSMRTGQKDGRTKLIVTLRNLGTRLVTQLNSLNLFMSSGQQMLIPAALPVRLLGSFRRVYLWYK